MTDGCTSREPGHLLRRVPYLRPWTYGSIRSVRIGDVDPDGWVRIVGTDERLWWHDPLRLVALLIEGRDQVVRLDDWITLPMLESGGGWHQQALLAHRPTPCEHAVAEISEVGR